MPLFTSKVTPAQQDQAVEVKEEEENATDEILGMRSTEMFVVLLHTVFECRGQRRPRIDSFKHCRIKEYSRSIDTYSRCDIDLHIS